MFKCMKYCLKTENGCLKIQTKHPLNLPKTKKTKNKSCQNQRKKHISDFLLHSFPPS